MIGYEFLDCQGTFRMKQPENTGYLYFPVAGENGLKGAVTPNLSGDLKVNQNTFVLQPASSEDLVESRVSRNFWCVLKDGSFYSLTGASAAAEAARFTDKQEESDITAGLMWQTLKRNLKAAGLESEITSFVPISDEKAECMFVSIKNSANAAVTFVPYAAVPIYGRSADNLRDHRHVTSLLHRVYTTQEGVFVKPTLSFDERGHQVNDMTYFVAGITGNGDMPVGFCPIVEDYTGEGGTYYQPEAIIKGIAFDEPGKEYAGYETIGAMQFAEVTLQPGETVSYIIRIGVVQNMDENARVHTSIVDENTALAALEETRKYWLEKVNVSYKTGDENFDNFMFWVNFQPILRRIYGCSFLPHHDYGKGGRGWRDLWQDCLALLIMNPDGVRQMLIDNYGGVRMDGSNATIIGAKQGEFIADRNNITRVWMDHGFWPLLTTKFYIDQTGDLEVLLKENSYFKDRQEMRGTATDDTFSKDMKPFLKCENGDVYKGTLLEHILVQNLTAFYETGAHNHMKLRGADWNDALDMAEDKGESVAFTAAYSQNMDTLADLIVALKSKTGSTSIKIAKEVAELFLDDCSLFESTEEKAVVLRKYCESVYPMISGEQILVDCERAVSCLRTMANWIREHIRKTEWIQNGENGWFNSYYDNHGEQVEGKHDDHVRMMLTGQVFTIMSGTATNEQIGEIVKAADEYLYDKKIGGYRLNSDFHEVKKDLGRAFGFAFGHKENGAVFSHMTTMYGNALYKQGFAKDGYKALNTLYKQAFNFEVSRIYPGIPEYFNDRGRGMYHYLTGAASWLMMTVITQMFGVRGEMGDLLFDPKLLKNQFSCNGEAKLTMDFAGKHFDITYQNPELLEVGEYKIADIVLNDVTLVNCDNRISLAEIQKLDDGVQKVIVTLKRV